MLGLSRDMTSKKASIIVSATNISMARVLNGFGFSFIERTSKPLKGTGFVIFGAVERLGVLATYSTIGLRSSLAR
jgi:hypothetical protein